MIITDQIQGPSLNIDSTAIHLRVPKKAVNDEFKALHDCDLFIRKEGPKKFHTYVISKLKELEKVT